MQLHWKGKEYIRRCGNTYEMILENEILRTLKLELTKQTMLKKKINNIRIQSELEMVY